MSQYVVAVGAITVATVCAIGAVLYLDEELRNDIYKIYNKQLNKIKTSMSHKTRSSSLPQQDMKQKPQNETFESKELEKLAEMGFYNMELNRFALEQGDGDLDNAVSFLLKISNHLSNENNQLPVYPTKETEEVAIESSQFEDSFIEIEAPGSSKEVQPSTSEEILEEESDDNDEFKSVDDGTMIDEINMDSLSVSDSSNEYFQKAEDFQINTQTEFVGNEVLVVPEEHLVGEEVDSSDCGDDAFDKMSEKSENSLAWSEIHYDEGDETVVVGEVDQTKHFVEL